MNPRGMFAMLPLMRALDTDKDGVISAEEIEKASESLKAIDSNKDGKLDMAELRPQPPEGADGGRFGLRGGPGDRGPEGRGPGMQPGKSPRDGDRPEGGRPEGDRPRPEGRGGDREGAPSPEAMVKRMMETRDADGNGTLSKSELPEPMQARFDTIDEDGNGELDAKELGKIAGRMGGRRGGSAGGDRPQRGGDKQ